nr:hypothetical protein B0A51_11022 [Rachicladosporium sp. CCFEE 5018]
MDEKHISTVERHELAEDEINGLKQTATMGTVTINDTEELMLVPQPSADPRDPLNMPKWRKVLFVVLLSIFSSAGLSMVSGFGGLLGFYIPGYVEKGATYADITALMTYPSMFMGVGNLISMPLALAIALATALQKVSGRSSPTVGLDSKAARHGYALLDLAAREQRCPDTDEELRRRLYIDGVGYLLRSLPESLTFEEEVALRAALPNSLAGNSIRSEQSGLQDRSHPRQTTTRKPLLHRAAATSALYTILALSVAIPCVQSVCSQAYTIDRRHKISDRLIASATAVAQSTTTQTLALAAVVWDLNDGRLRRAVGDLGVWLARDLSGGAHEGVMEAIGRLKLEGENGRSS